MSELLAGQLPFPSSELRRAGLAEIQRKIREDDPVRVLYDAFRNQYGRDTFIIVALEPDALVVASNGKIQAEHACRAMDAGCHVLSEATA